VFFSDSCLSRENKVNVMSGYSVFKVAAHNADEAIEALQDVINDYLDPARPGFDLEFVGGVCVFMEGSQWIACQAVREVPEKQ